MARLVGVQSLNGEYIAIRLYKRLLSRRVNAQRNVGRVDDLSKYDLMFELKLQIELTSAGFRTAIKLIALNASFECELA